MTASGVFVRREWFDPAKLPSARAVTVKARDGLMLHGYFTPPRGVTGSGPAPMVVMPFGVFDARSFDDDTQLLAWAAMPCCGSISAVRAITARASGVPARANGADACRTDSPTLHAGRSNRTSPTRRVSAIYGASYGAYVALMGAAREPDLYRCAVGYVGVYDLEAMHRKDSRMAGWMRNWGQRLGERARHARRAFADADAGGSRRRYSLRRAARIASRRSRTARRWSAPCARRLPARRANGTEVTKQSCASVSSRLRLRRAPAAKQHVRYDGSRPLALAGA